MNEVSFDFHGLVGFDYSGDGRGRDFYEAEYGAAKGTPPAAPRVRLRWNAGGRIAGGTQTSHKQLARWTYRITGEAERLELDAAGNRWALPMVHHMLVHHALRLQASRSGAILLHASAVARNGRSLILTGAGGGGKTTTSSLLLHAGAGWAPHADDYIFLREGASHHYPSRAHLYLDLARWIPAVEGILSPEERLRLQVLGHVRRLSGDGLKWPVRMPLGRLWPGRPPQATARIGALVLLERTETLGPRLTRLVDGEVVRQTLIEMNFREAEHFLRLARLAGLHAGSSSWIPEWKERERQALAGALDGASLFRLELPRSSRPSPEVGHQIVGLLDPLVSAAP